MQKDLATQHIISIVILTNWPLICVNLMVIKIIPMLIKHHTTKMYAGVQVKSQTFLTLALDGGEQSMS
jgi:hypothetical protein